MYASRRVRRIRTSRRYSQTPAVAIVLLLGLKQSHDRADKAQGERQDRWWTVWDPPLAPESYNPASKKRAFPPFVQSKRAHGRWTLPTGQQVSISLAQQNLDLPTFLLVDWANSHSSAGGFFFPASPTTMAQWARGRGAFGAFNSFFSKEVGVAEQGKSGRETGLRNMRGKSPKRSPSARQPEDAPSFTRISGSAPARSFFWRAYRSQYAAKQLGALPVAGHWSLGRAQPVNDRTSMPVPSSTLDYIAGAAPLRWTSGNEGSIHDDPRRLRSLRQEDCMASLPVLADRGYSAVTCEIDAR